MRSSQWLSLTAVLLAGGGVLTYAQRARPSSARDSPIERIGWLAGCFEMRSGTRVVEEVRMGVRAGSMLGMGRTSTPQGLKEYELTLIAERDGGLVYEAHPSGQPAAVFKANVVTSDSVIFAAPEHDYPQIVGYARAGKDSVIAWIDGTAGGKRKRVAFPYRRVPCPM
jgi:uncharacterized protein DUF6265